MFYLTPNQNEKAFLSAAVVLFRPGTIGATHHQVVWGTVTDGASKTPILGASVLLLNTAPAVGAITNGTGRFRLTQVPVGRVSLRATLVGYEDLF
jgi:hypothetical protein